jgi:hypothetical protein
MAKFVDINSLIEKTLDGSESVQVSDTQKSKLVNILTQLGKNLQMAVNGSDSWQLPNFDTNSTPVQNWLNALAFACGLRDESTGWGPFRIINGNDGDIAYFVILWYDNINNLTEAFVIGSYPEKVITLYEKSGKQHLTVDNNQDNAVIQDIISTGRWSKVATIAADSVIKQTYGTNTQFLAPVQGSETLLTTTIERILYALGFRGTNTNFRFLTGVNNTSETYWGVAFYNTDQSKTFTVLFGIGGSSIPVGMYQKSGNVTTQKPVDSKFIQDVLSTWTKSWELKGGGSSDIEAKNVTVTTPTLFDDTSAPTVHPQDQNNLQQLIQWILYTFGVRNDANGLGRTMFIVHGNGNMGIIIQDTQNVDIYYALIFGDGEYLHSYTIESTSVSEWVGNYYSDVDILNSILEGGTLIGSIPFDMSVFATKTYVKPNDAVLTAFPSGHRTIIPGENLTTNLTSGTLKVKVPNLLTLQVKSGPFRDAVIDVPYGVTVQFADQVEIVYKADDVDGFTAKSGRKVYTIHFVPTTSSTTNITFRAFVNVTNYK